MSPSSGLGYSCWAGQCPVPPPVGGCLVASRGPDRPTGPQMANTVLTAPRRVMHSRVGGRTEQIYVSQGQLVKVSAVLLKLSIDAGPLSHWVFVSAPVAGNVANLKLRAGYYLRPAPWAWLLGRVAPVVMHSNQTR